MDLSHVEKTERALGDPQSSTSPINFAEILKHDAEQTFPEHAAQVLRELQFSAYYVPSDLGGRFKRVDELLFALRILSRRDLTLAIGHAVTMLGAIPVWVGGSTEQRQQCAALVLSDQPLAFALTEREHGSDLLASDMTLTDDGKTLAVTGEKWLINNATRSAALTVYMQAAGKKGTRGSVVAFICKDQLPAESWQTTPKIATVGIRGADISGIRITNAPLLGEHIVGRVGQGLDLVWRGLQITRTLCSGLSLGAADTCLRIVARAMACDPETQPSIRNRQGLASMVEQVLFAEAVALSATRIAHVAPQELGLVSSVTKYYAPTRIEETFRIARSILGLRAVHLQGPYSVFEKFARDQGLVSLFEGSTIVSLQMIATHLRGITRRADDRKSSVASTAEALFDLKSSLPPVAVESLTSQLSSAEIVSQFALHELPNLLPPHHRDGAMGKCLAAGAERLRKLYKSVLEIEGDWSMQDPRWFSLAREFCKLFAVSSLAAIWHFNRERVDFVDHPLFSLPDGPAPAIQRQLGANGALPPSEVDCYVRWVTARLDSQRAMSILPFYTPWDSHALELIQP